MPFPRNDSSERLAPGFAISSHQLHNARLGDCSRTAHSGKLPFFVILSDHTKPGAFAPATHFVRDPLALPQGGYRLHVNVRIERKCVKQSIRMLLLRIRVSRLGLRTGKELKPPYMRFINTRILVIV